MPLTFVITKEDVLRGKIVDPGWYKVNVKNVRQEAAATDGSTNTWIDMVILEGPFKDVPLLRNFNEKAPGFAIPFITALGGKVTEEGATFDMERAKGKQLLVYVKNGMYKDKPQNQVEDFKPLA